MPLHLLGKKSWNVYNTDNIARVKLDEAVAKVRTQREERELHDNAASNRLRALRGEEPLDIVQSVLRNEDDQQPHAGTRDSHRKKRKLAGEDDTDRDIRLAKADVEDSSRPRSNKTLTEPDGHIDLISGKRPRPDKQPESEQGALEGMRFKDAAGYNVDRKPWYADRTTSVPSSFEVGRDVWGNEDPRRRERERNRMNANDPLLAIKKGVKQVRENDRQRVEWIEQREKDLYEVERLAQQERRRRRRRSTDEESLEEFSLDASPHSRKRHRGTKSGSEKGHHRHRHRRRSRSPRNDPHKHRPKKSSSH